MMEWRHTCESSIRINAQMNGRSKAQIHATRQGQQHLEQELWSLNIAVLNGNLSSKDAAFKIQNGFSQWFKPQNK